MLPDSRSQIGGQRLLFASVADLGEWQDHPGAQNEVGRRRLARLDQVAREGSVDPFNHHQSSIRIAELFPTCLLPRESKVPGPAELEQVDDRARRHGIG